MVQLRAADLKLVLDGAQIGRRRRLLVESVDHPEYRLDQGPPLVAPFFQLGKNRVRLASTFLPVLLPLGSRLGKPFFELSGTRHMLRRHLLVLCSGRSVLLDDLFLLHNRRFMVRHDRFMLRDGLLLLFPNLLDARPRHFGARCALS